MLIKVLIKRRYDFISSYSLLSYKVDMVNVSKFLQLITLSVIIITDNFFANRIFHGYNYSCSWPPKNSKIL